MAVRQPIITVAGHVDSGKTSFLDAIRGTSVAEREEGRITQHIGATEVPLEALKGICGPLMAKTGISIKVPGLLFIDTPGHEAFTNLRKRGGSISDLAVLMVDAMEGFKPQTTEALEIFKSYKTPFVVALNKVDRINGWVSVEGNPIGDSIALQSEKTIKLLEEKLYSVVGSLSSHGFDSERFDRITDMTRQIVIIPLSAKTREGIPEALLYLAGLAQKFLSKELETEVEGPGKGVVLEVKEEKGLGKTIDVILYDGVVKAGDSIIVGGINGAFEAKVRAILKPKPLDEIRDPRERFESVRQVSAAAGVKIAAPGLENALAGAPVLVAVDREKALEEVQREVESVRISTDLEGVILKADTLGSLEAIAKLLKDNGIALRKADVGSITRQDVLEATGVGEKNRFLACVFGFNVRMEEAARELSESKDVKVFSSKVVYTIISEYKEWIAKEREAQKRQELYKLTLPAKFEVLRGMVFRNAKPAIFWVKVVAGMLRQGYSVMNEKGEILGKVKAMRSGEKSLEAINSGEEAAVSVDGPIIGRHVFEGEHLYSFISREEAMELEKKHASFLKPEELALLKHIREIARAAALS
ncbi:MAG TPA: translation initiation factor IF-2 [archaeon]|nr:translation initiation factor IF-2 [archaeon]